LVQRVNIVKNSTFLLWHNIPTADIWEQIGNPAWEVANLYHGSTQTTNASSLPAALALTCQQPAVGKIKPVA
jgi:hypothetical protein